MGILGPNVRRLLLKQEISRIIYLYKEKKLSITELIRCLGDYHPSVRGRAAVALEKIAEMDVKIVRPAVPLLIQLVYDDDSFVCKQAILALKRIAKSGVEQVRPVIPALIKRLNNEDASVRTTAGDLLKKIGKRDVEAIKPAVPALVKRLGDRRGEVRSVAVAILRKIAEEDVEAIKPALSALVERLHDKVFEVHAGAADVLEKVVEKDVEAVKPAVPALIERLNDENTWVRTAVASVLEKIAERNVETVKSAVSTFVDRLSDEDPLVRASVAGLLEKIAEIDIEAVKLVVPFVERLNDENPSVRASVANVVRELVKKDVEAVKSAIPALTKQLDARQRTARTIAVTTLEEIAERDVEAVKPAVPLLIKRLNDPTRDVRSVAISILKKIAETDIEAVKPAVPVLIKRLNDKMSRVRAGAADILAKLIERDVEAVKPAIRMLIKMLIKRLDDEDPAVRAAAADVLAKIAERDVEAVKPAMPALIKQLNDEDPAVRAGIAAVLEKIAGGDAEEVKPAVPAIIKRLDDEDAAVRAGAARILGRIAKSDIELAKSAVSKLVLLLDDSSGAVRGATAFALGELGMGKALDKLEALVNDTGRCWLGGKRHRVGKVAREAIEKIKKKLPRLEVSLSPSRFTFGAWSPCHLVLRNMGEGKAEVVGITFSDEVEVKKLHPKMRLRAGEEGKLSFYLKPKDRGQVPMEVTLRCRDHLGEEYKVEELVVISVSGEEGTTPSGTAKGKTKERIKVPLYFPEELVPFYEPLDYIAKGGFARVYRARRRKDGVPVALKIPLDPEDPGIRDSLRTEIANWLRLRHGNIVQLYNVGTVPTVFLEMELCEGSLAEERKPLEPTKAAKLLFEAARGLEYAHRQGLIHRDVKPSNILLKDGVPKLSDWGLSRVKTKSRSTSSRAFTPPYSAPEQHSPRKFGGVDERTDIFQLGIVLYELVTGRLPFEGEEYFEIASAVQFEKPVPPSELNPEASLVEPVILKCLQKDKDTRYANVRGFREALAEVLREGYGMAVALSRDSRDFRRATTDSVELALIAADLEDVQEIKAHLEEASDLAREVLPRKLSQQILHSLESAFGLLELCVRGKVSFGEAMKLWDEAKEFLPEKLCRLVEEDPDLGQRMKHFTNLYAPDDFLSQEHLEDVRGMCHRLIRKWQAFVLETSG